MSSLLWNGWPVIGTKWESCHAVHVTEAENAEVVAAKAIPSRIQLPNMVSQSFMMKMAICMCVEVPVAVLPKDIAAMKDKKRK